MSHGARSDDFATFDGQDLRSLFSEIDAELSAGGSKTVYRVVIVGGAAVALVVPGRLTGDVDVVSEGMPDELRRAAASVAARHNLRPDWINDAAKAKTVAIAAESKPVFEGRSLIVESASLRYILAMKLTSARPIDHDDCVALVRELRIHQVDELLDLIEEALPWMSRRTVTMRYFAESVIEAASDAGDTSSAQRRGRREALRSVLRGHRGDDKPKT